MYKRSVRPVLEYSSTAWSTTAKTNQQSLDMIQNQALRIITDAMKSTPITFMEQTTTIQPLQQRRQAKVLLQAEKYKCLPDHPMKESVEGRTKNRNNTGKHGTNYRAEAEALKQTATLVKDSLEPCSHAVFLNDALSVLEANERYCVTLTRVQHCILCTNERYCVALTRGQHCILCTNERYFVALTRVQHCILCTSEPYCVALKRVQHCILCINERYLCGLDASTTVHPVY